MQGVLKRFCNEGYDWVKFWRDFKFPAKISTNHSPHYKIALGPPAEWSKMSLYITRSSNQIIWQKLVSTISPYMAGQVAPGHTSYPKGNLH